MKWSIFTTLAALSSSLLAQVSDADALLNKVISRPGSYSQVCDVMMAPADIPYRAFQLADFSGASFSKTNQALIEKNREALIKAVRARLLAVDFSKEAKQPGTDPKPEENFDGETFGCDPKSLNPLLLELIRQLHAIETLPELLVVEQKLVEGIAKAKDDVKVAPPVVYGWSVAIENDSRGAFQGDRKINLFQARVAQRDLVMLMASLMREKSYPPYLETTLETAYVKGLKAEARAQSYDKYQPGPDLKKQLDELQMEVDPISKVIRAKYFSVKIPYTRESRDEVRAAAEKWIAAHP